jgi:hypothetical protein
MKARIVSEGIGDLYRFSMVGGVVNIDLGKIRKDETFVRLVLTRITGAP